MGLSPAPAVTVDDVGCGEALTCREDGCDEQLRAAGFVHPPSDLNGQPVASVWCSPPTKALGVVSPALPAQLALGAVILLAVAFTRGPVLDPARRSSWARRALALGLALGVFASTLALHRRGALTSYLHEQKLALAVIAAVALGAAWLAERARTRMEAGGIRIVGAALAPLVAGAALAERERIASVAILAREWDGLGFDLRGRILAELVDEDGSPFVLGLAATAAVATASAFLDADPTKRTPLGAPRFVLASLLVLLPFGLGARALGPLALGGVVVVLGAVLARGARRAASVTASLTVALAFVFGALRDLVSGTTWEEAWAERFDLVQRAGIVLELAVPCVAAAAALGVVAGRAPAVTKKSLFENLRVGLVLAGASVGAFVPFNLASMIARESSVARRWMDAATTVELPTADASGAQLAPRALRLRGDALEGAALDESAAWTAYAPRAAPLRVLPVVALLPRAMPRDDVRRHLEPAIDPTTPLYVVVRASQPEASAWALALVGPPLRTVPMLLGYDAEAGDPDRTAVEPVTVRLHGERVLVGEGSDATEVAVRDAPDALAPRCRLASTWGRHNGLLVVVLDRELSVDELVQLGAKLVPGLELDERHSGRCAFRALAFTRSAR